MPTTSNTWRSVKRKKVWTQAITKEVELRPMVTSRCEEYKKMSNK